MAVKSLPVKDITRVLSNIHPSELGEYINAARESIDRKAYLTNLFECQLRTLEFHGVGENIIHLLTNQKEKVIEYTLNNDIQTGNVPFLPVLPAGYRSVFDQIACIKFGNRPGYCYLKWELVKHHYNTPEEPYYIFNVNPGESWLNTEPLKTKAELEETQRFALTVEEALSLALHENILDHFAIDAAGSYLETQERIPHIYPTIARAGLGWCYNTAHKEWAIPSCSLREVMRNG